ncbi:MAG: class I SAM-dependent methyltransferase, partial [Pseudobdellovibrio sp.]
YSNQQFDIVSISFGIRNVNDPIRGLQEMARVCRPGGRVMVLEFGQMNIPILGSVYKFYSESVLPILGGWVTGQKAAYDYLQKSSAAFPCREGFLDLMKKSNAFKTVEYVPVSFGIAYVYIGTVI